MTFEYFEYHVCSAGLSAPLATVCDRMLPPPACSYCRDHLRHLAQRVEADEGQVSIMGSKGNLLRTL